MREKFNLPKNKQTVVGVGSALIDMLISEDDAFLAATGAAKGGMELVGFDRIEHLLNRTRAQVHIVPGGSACNTTVGVARLGGAARFVGKCGQGKMGARLKGDLRKSNVEPLLFTSPSPTGRVLSIITPDAQRSMFTFLGASAETRPEEIVPGCFRDAAIVHVEGYLLFNTELMHAVLATAKRSGARISLDLASFNVVLEARAQLETIIDAYVDILIANEDEAKAFTGMTDETQALSALANRAELVIMKVGRRGSYVAHRGRIYKIEPLSGQDAVDTTGAGDLWAAGFLFGLLKGMSIEKSGALGSACGYEVCQTIGANIPEAGWARIKNSLED